MLGNQTLSLSPPTQRRSPNAHAARLQLLGFQGARCFMSFVAWHILTFKFEQPSHLEESAPSCRRVEISSVARFNRIGQLDNFKTALAAR